MFVNMRTFIVDFRIGILFGISILIFFVFSLKRNGNFLTVKDVILNHVSIFENDKSQYILFYFMPITIACGIVMVDTVTESVLSSIIVVLSILLTMLFTLMGTLVSADYKVDKGIQELVKQTVNTLLYESFVCIIELLLCLVVLFVNDFNESKILIVASFLIYYFMIHITVNIFLIIQRIGVIFTELTD